MSIHCPECGTENMDNVVFCENCGTKLNSDGYLVCDKCKGYYKLKPGEKPDDFVKCECGGKLKFSKNIQSKDISTSKGKLKKALIRAVVYIAYFCIVLMGILANIVNLWNMPITNIFFIGLLIVGGFLVIRHILNHGFKG